MIKCAATVDGTGDATADDVHAAIMHLMRAKSQLNAWDPKYVAISIACSRAEDAYQLFIEELLK